MDFPRVQGSAAQAVYEREHAVSREDRGRHPELAARPEIRRHQGIAPQDQLAVHQVQLDCS